MCLTLNKGVTNFHHTFDDHICLKIFFFSYFYVYDAMYRCVYLTMCVCVIIHLRFQMLNLRVHFTTMFDPIVLNTHKKNLMNCS